MRITQIHHLLQRSIVPFGNVEAACDDTMLQHNAVSIGQQPKRKTTLPPMMDVVPEGSNLMYPIALFCLLVFCMTFAMEHAAQVRVLAIISLGKTYILFANDLSKSGGVVTDTTLSEIWCMVQVCI